MDIGGDHDAEGHNDGDGYIDIEDNMEAYEQILQQALEESSQQEIKVETPEAETLVADSKPFIPPSQLHKGNATAVPTMTMTTRRAIRQAMTPPVLDPSERTTRNSQFARPKPQPKLKLKVSERQSSGTSFLGQYDRELDSEDEDLSFEEHFILRMPPGDDCEKLRAMVERREMSKDVWFKFKGDPNLRLSRPNLSSLLACQSRFSPGCLPYWQYVIHCETR